MIELEYEGRRKDGTQLNRCLHCQPRPHYGHLHVAWRNSGFCQRVAPPPPSSGSFPLKNDYVFS